MIIEFILFGTVFLFVLLYFNKKPSYLPPGTWGWPIVGIVPRGRAQFYSLLDEYRNNYGGGLYCSNIGSRIAVFITDFELVKKALAKPEFSGRPDFFTVKTFGDGLGISMAVGKVWSVNRRFTVKNLRDFGMGKSKMEVWIHREVESLVQEFESHGGKSFVINNAINIAVLNITWALAADTRFDLNDKEIIKFCELNLDNFRILQSQITFLDFYPWANYLPKIIKDKFLRACDLEKNKEDFKTYLMNYIINHQEKLDKENPHDFIDMYLIDMEENKDPELDFKSNLRNLVNILMNFFNGSEVTANTLRWFVNMMAKHQDIQEKAYAEIEEFVSNKRLPNLDDKQNLPYIQACLEETSRMASMVIFGIPHATTENTEFEGYHIPKGSVVFPCLEECHRDRKYWDKLEIFYPQHFLDQEGNLNGKTSGMAPFSLGKRICPGKSISEMGLFLFGAAILQKFKIRPAEGAHIDYEPDNFSAFFNFPKKYELIFERRI